MIEEELLIQFGAKQVNNEKEDVLFREGDQARYYYQIIEGEVKMSHFNDEGKEFIQGIFSAGRCFGEPPLFGEFNYPVNAICIENCKFWRLEKAAFIQLLEENPKVAMSFTRVLANRLYFKAIMSNEISVHESGHRILTLLDYLKKDIYKIEGEYTYKVELTRQQIADLSGLRVETVIRTMKDLESKGEIKRIDRKVYR